MVCISTVTSLELAYPSSDRNYRSDSARRPTLSYWVGALTNFQRLLCYKSKVIDAGLLCRIQDRDNSLPARALICHERDVCRIALRYMLAMERNSLSHGPVEGGARGQLAINPNLVLCIYHNLDRAQVRDTGHLQPRVRR